MKKAYIVISVFLALTLLWGTVVSATPGETLDYTVSSTGITVSSDSKVSFQIVVPAQSEPYGGIQYAVRLPDGVTFDTPGVVFDTDFGTLIGLQQAPSTGVWYFSRYAETNVFTERITCTVNLIYSAEAPRVVTIEEVKTVRIQGEADTSTNVGGRTLITINPIGEPGNDPGDDPGDDPGNGALFVPGGDTEVTAPPVEAGGESNDSEDIDTDEIPGGQTDESGPALNRDSTVGYVNGYPDLTFRPNSNITRYEAAMMFYNLIADVEKASFGSSVSTFSDAEEGQWYSEAVGYLAEKGVLSGYPDGTFKGGNAITRAEFVTVASKFGITDTGTPGVSFPDVPEDHWAFEYIKSAYDSEWILGYPDGTFGPDRMITRAESVVIINNILGWDTVKEGAENPFTDVSAEDWFYTDVMIAASGR